MHLFKIFINVDHQMMESGPKKIDKGFDQI